MVNGTARANIQIGTTKRIRNIFPLNPSLFPLKPNLSDSGLEASTPSIFGGDGVEALTFGFETVIT